MVSPHSTNDTYSLVHSELIYSTLTRLDKDGGTAPGLAERWDVTPDGLSYTFHLNAKATWHDGKPVSADDVAFALTSLSDPRTKSIYASRFNNVKGVKAYRDGSAPTVEGFQAVDPRTFRILLDAPVAPMLGQLGVQAPIIPKHILGAAKPEELEKHPYWANPTVGSGPLKFVRYQTDQFMELDRHEPHHLGAVSFPKMILRLGSQDVLQAQIQKGEVDMAAIPTDEADRLKSVQTVTVFQYPTTVAQSLYVNLEKPYLQDLRVRQALSYAIDRAKIAETVQGDPTLANFGPVNGPAWAISPNLTKYSFDQEKARQLLKDAGWDSSRKVVYRYPTGNKARERMAPLIQDAYKAVGIDLDLRLSDFATMQNDAKDGQFDLLSLGNQNGYDPDSLANQYTSASIPPGGVNFGRYKSERVDEIFKTAAATLDQGKRATLYHEFQDIVTRELPRIWIPVDPEVMAINKRIGGIAPSSAWGLLRSVYWNIHQWTVTD
ncbi:MAG: hypothetical protein IT305_31530 [Chloroflexi bacterium]|nr:hypothetical protein [Chloroflexota bacterium]